MTGVLLETLSNKKIFKLIVLFVLVQVVFFLLGGLVAPKPANVLTALGRFCIDDNIEDENNRWFSPRTSKECHNITSLQNAEDKQISADQIVFAFEMPLPRENKILEMSRWFQNIISVLHIKTDYSNREGQRYLPGSTLMMDARLGGRDINTEWTTIAKSTEKRKLNCEVTKHEEGYPLDCEVLHFFELGSCFYDYYLINIKLPTWDNNTNRNMGKISDLELVMIHNNGGFTKVWFSMKTVMFPVLIAALVFFWFRINEQEANKTLTMKMLFCLGLALSFLNLPIEWFTLWFDMPYMLLITDIRQGIFFAVLLCFWLVFAGEHKMDSLIRSDLSFYWKHLSAVMFGCICLFVFDICERGVQLYNPFFSIWVTEAGTKLGITFIALAGLAACLYFFFLCYMVVQVFRNINAKKTALPHMSNTKRKFFSNVIFRFRFLMSVTLVCAACTVIFFILSDISEGNYNWGDENIHVEYASAFFTGVYGMWNLYVIGLLILFSPSTKKLPEDESMDRLNSVDEEIEFSTIPSEVSVLSAFVQKASTD